MECRMFLSRGITSRFFLGTLNLAGKRDDGNTKDTRRMNGTGEIETWETGA